MIEYTAVKLGCTSFEQNDLIAMEKFIFEQNLHPQIQSINDFELYGTICHFLFELGRELAIDLQSDDLLIKSLISHIKSMDNWRSGDFNFDIEREYNSFKEFFQIRLTAEDKFYILEKYLTYELTAKMKDSIIIHICASILRSRRSMQPCNVIVSCPGSMATSRYLSEQAQSYFNFNIVNTVSARQLENADVDLSDTDFIISTVPIHGCALPVIVVNPLLTLEDINKIQSTAFACIDGRNDSKNTPLQKYPLIASLYELYESSSEDKRAALDCALDEFIKNIQKMQQETLPQCALLQMLKPKYIKINTEKISWKDAMKEAASDLLKDGYFDKSYVEEAISNVEEYGSYIIVSKGIALAHASRENGVYEDGIALLVSREGICFEDGESVKLLFFFAQKGDTDYLDLFKDIIELGTDPANVEKLSSLALPGEAYNAIVRMLQSRAV